MRRLILIALSILALYAISGCATIVTSKANLPESSNIFITEDPKGIRVYPSRVYLMVGSKESRLILLPDYTQAYDVNPFVLLGTSEFKIELRNGQIISLGSKTNTTEFIEVLKTVKGAIMAAQGLPTFKNMKAITLPGEVLGKHEVLIYRLDDDGVFKEVKCNGCDIQ